MMKFNCEIAIYPRFKKGSGFNKDFDDLICGVTKRVKNIFEIEEKSENMIRRLYFGSDSCIKQFYRSLPPLNELRHLKEEGYDITIVTPPLFETEIKKIFDCLMKIQDKVGEIEVVINDFGFAFYLKEKFFEKKILGVLLNKSLRDPRITMLFDSVITDKKDLFSMAPFSSQYFKNVLLEFSIDGIEFDSLIQGIDTKSFWKKTFFGIIHFPYLHVTKGYSCFWAGYYKKYGKFISDNKEFCNYDCERFGFEIEDGKYKYKMVGNQVLFPVKECVLKKILDDDCENFFKRIVFNYI